MPSHRRARAWPIIVLAGAALVGAARAAAPADATMPAQAARQTDLRVLIDVSGSMRHNDPHNLRAPALRLLVGLMPEGMRSGVWTFGQYVNMNVPLGRVDAQWKARARRAAGEIHSHGLFTNMGEALARATADWQRPDPRSRRHLILLTDGMVDVSKDPAADRAARKHILQDILPRLRAAHAAVDTIALSDQADAELLMRLAEGTGGWFDQVDSAAQLDRLFLRLFEQSTPAQALPLKDNRFHVDAGIRDMTVLVFHDPDAEPVRLIGPDGRSQRAAGHPNNVHWSHEAHHDLVTIARPASGDWHIRAPVDPDNRVLVVTNLSLKLGPLSTQLVQGEPMGLSARLDQDGKPLAKPDLLRLIQVTAANGDDGAGAAALHDNGKPPDAKAGDGVFSARLQAPASPGDYTLSVRAASPTFERVEHRRLRVHAVPLTVKLAAGDDGYRADVALDGGWLDPSGATLRAHLSGTPSRALAVKDGGGDGRWTVPVAAPEQARASAGVSAPELVLDVSAPDRSGHVHRFQVSRALPLAEPAAVSKQKAGAKPKAAGLSAERPAESAAGAVHWWSVALWVVGADVLLAGLGFGAYCWWRRRRRAAGSIEDELESTS